MASSIISNSLIKALEDATAELALHIKKYILEAFDNEHGYTEDGQKVEWKPLNPDYIKNKPPRGRGGSSNPILNFEGDLRASIRAVAKGFSIDTDVISGKMKARGKGEISVAEISSILSTVRPHTFAPPDKEVEKLGELIRKHLGDAIDKLRRDGTW